MQNKYLEESDDEERIQFSDEYLIRNYSVDYFDSLNYDSDINTEIVIEDGDEMIIDDVDEDLHDSDTDANGKLLKKRYIESKTLV